MPKNAVRIFLDSNVILSGLFSDKGAPRVILDILCLGLPALSGSTGQYNLIEIERNLKKKMPDALLLYNEYLPVLNLEIITLPSSERIKSLAGRIADKDVPVLASTTKGKADYLITGDKKDFAKLRGLMHSPQIISPSEFIETVLPKILKALGD